LIATTLQYTPIDPRRHYINNVYGYSVGTPTQSGYMLQYRHPPYFALTKTKIIPNPTSNPNPIAVE